MIFSEQSIMKCGIVATFFSSYFDQTGCLYHLPCAAIDFERGRDLCRNENCRMVIVIKRHPLREPTLTPRFGSRASEPAEQCREMTLTFESRACADLDER